MRILPLPPLLRSKIMADGRGIILAAPASGSGKTTVTLGLLRALKNRGTSVRSAKSGPDYIDGRFHQAALGQECVNLDAWAMTPARIKNLAAGPGHLIIEGAMGLFDGAPPRGKGATADLARLLNLPVILVVDAGKQAQSIAPLVAGFAGFDPKVRLAGVILNNVGSARHEAMLRGALDPLGLPVLGAIARQKTLRHPSRHLGLVQAEEREDLQNYLENVARIIEQSVDISEVLRLSAPLPMAKGATLSYPPGQVIAIAKDRAFAFAYPHLLADWHARGAELKFFSPLQNQPPPPSDFIFLPGGYPELHAGKLAAANLFLEGLTLAATDTQIYGECGGYMVLGNALIDAAGTVHRMAGLLDLKTSFAQPKLHLGYRQLEPLAGPLTEPQLGHEFHYASTVYARGAPLFKARDAMDVELADMGLVRGRVCGSFAHIIDAVN